VWKGLSTWLDALVEAWVEGSAEGDAGDKELNGCVAHGEGDSWLGRLVGIEKSLNDCV